MRAHDAVAGAAVAAGGAENEEAALVVTGFAGRRQNLAETDAREGQAVGSKNALGTGRYIVTEVVLDGLKKAVLGCGFDAGR